MPLIIEGRVPSRWAEKTNSRSVVSIDRYVNRSKCLNLALINNMPDAALEDTELQFFDLLDIASGDAFVFLKLYSLTGVPRTDRGQRHVNEFYFGLDELWNNSRRCGYRHRDRAASAGFAAGTLLVRFGRGYGLGRAQHGVDGSVVSSGARRCSAQRWYPAPSVCLTSSLVCLSRRSCVSTNSCGMEGPWCGFRILDGTRCKRTR